MDKTVGAKLRALRLEKNKSQGDIEASTGLLRCYLSRVENGHTIPSLDTLQKLLSALDMTLAQFFQDGTPKQETSGPALDPADRAFLIAVNKYSSRLTASQKAWLLEMVKRFAKTLGDGPIPPQRTQLHAGGR
jgi:transcriptional regulator with XRE-family HTH domain